MTSALANFARDRDPLDAAPIDPTSQGVNQGDCLYLNAGGGVISLASSANSPTFCGVAVASSLPTAAALVDVTDNRALTTEEQYNGLKV